MYKQIKQYVVLAEEEKKIVNAGLLKIHLMDKKIRIEYFLGDLPVFYGIEMECVLWYRQKGESVSTKAWKDTLKKENSHYVYVLSLSEKVEEVLDCSLLLQGNKKIVAEEQLSRQKRKIQESSLEKGSEKLSIKNEKDIRYIRDLDYLKNRQDAGEELYYNSFLLHGFYQYRYFIEGENFIGVPDHFYEREAIAARMMGFPYFIEAEYIESCNLDGDVRGELPKQGSFGYFLRKISPHREEKPMES